MVRGFKAFAAGIESPNGFIALHKMNYLIYILIGTALKMTYLHLDENVR